MRTAKIDIGIKILLIKDGDYITAYSPELDFSSFGKDEKDAMDAFDEALKLILEGKKSVIERLHELEDMLEKTQLEAARKEPTTPWEEIRAELDKKYGIVD